MLKDVVADLLQRRVPPATEDSVGPPALADDEVPPVDRVAVFQFICGPALAKYGNLTVPSKAWVALELKPGDVLDLVLKASVDSRFVADQTRWVFYRYIMRVASLRAYRLTVPREELAILQLQSSHIVEVTLRAVRIPKLDPDRSQVVYRQELSPLPKSQRGTPHA